MLKIFLHRYTRKFEQRHRYDGTYMHELIDVSPVAFIRFAIMQLAGGEWHTATVPINAWFAASIAGALIEDCGPCVQIVTDMAITAGMSGEIIAALLAGQPTDMSAQLGFDFGRSLLLGGDSLDEARRGVEAAWGKRALIALSLRAMSARNFPVLKRAMGHAKICQRIKVGSTDVTVNPMLKAA